MSNEINRENDMKKNQEIAMNDFRRWTQVKKKILESATSWNVILDIISNFFDIQDRIITNNIYQISYNVEYNEYIKTHFLDMLFGTIFIPYNDDSVDRYFNNSRKDYSIFIKFTHNVIIYKYYKKEIEILNYNNKLFRKSMDNNTVFWHYGQFNNLIDRYEDLIFNENLYKTYSLYHIGFKIEKEINLKDFHIEKSILNHYIKLYFFIQESIILNKFNSHEIDNIIKEIIEKRQTIKRAFITNESMKYAVEMNIKTMLLYEEFDKKEEKYSNNYELAYKMYINSKENVHDVNEEIDNLIEEHLLFLKRKNSKVIDEIIEIKENSQFNNNNEFSEIVKDLEDNDIKEIDETLKKNTAILIDIIKKIMED